MLILQFPLHGLRVLPYLAPQHFGLQEAKGEAESGGLELGGGHCRYLCGGDRLIPGQLVGWRWHSERVAIWGQEGDA